MSGYAFVKTKDGDYSVFPVPRRRGGKSLGRIVRSGPRDWTAVRADGVQSLNHPTREAAARAMDATP